MGNDKNDMTATVKPLRVMSWLDNDESAALLSTALLILGKVGYEDACSSRNKKKESAPQREIQPKCRWLIELLFRKITHRCGGFDIPSAPPVMLLRSEDFSKILSAPQHHLHPNSRILSGGQILYFQRVAHQNPPVLQPLETVCSRSKHPLSSVSGRRRYNTLDFPQENRVPTGRFHPYWKPRSKGTCSPFTIPARLRICGHKLKNGLQTQIHKRKKSQSVPPSRRGILWEYIMPHDWKF